MKNCAENTGRVKLDLYITLYKITISHLSKDLNVRLETSKLLGKTFQGIGIENAFLEVLGWMCVSGCEATRPPSSQMQRRASSSSCSLSISCKSTTNWSMRIEKLRVTVTGSPVIGPCHKAENVSEAMHVEAVSSLLRLLDVKTSGGRTNEQAMQWGPQACPEGTFPPIKKLIVSR